MTREEKIDVVLKLLDKHEIKYIYEHVCKLTDRELDEIIESLSFE